MAAYFPAGLVALCLSGCGGPADDTPELGLVTGTVMLDGKPLPGVMVAFEPEAGGRASLARTDAQGNYELVFNGTTKGAAVGAHKVLVTTPTDAPDPSGHFRDPIPAKYNAKTELVQTVQAGENKISLELTSH